MPTISLGDGDVFAIRNPICGCYLTASYPTQAGCPNALSSPLAHQCSSICCASSGMPLARLHWSGHYTSRAAFAVRPPPEDSLGDFSLESFSQRGHYLSVHSSPQTIFGLGTFSQNVPHVFSCLLGASSGERVPPPPASGASSGERVPPPPANGASADVFGSFCLLKIPCGLSLRRRDAGHRGTIRLVSPSHGAKVSPSSWVDLLPAHPLVPAISFASVVSILQYVSHGAHGGVAGFTVMQGRKVGAVDAGSPSPPPDPLCCEACSAVYFVPDSADEKGSNQSYSSIRPSFRSAYIVLRTIKAASHCSSSAACRCCCTVRSLPAPFLYHAAHCIALVRAAAQETGVMMLSNVAPSYVCVAESNQNPSPARVLYDSVCIPSSYRCMPLVASEGTPLVLPWQCKSSVNQRTQPEPFAFLKTVQAGLNHGDGVEHRGLSVPWSTDSDGLPVQKYVLARGQLAALSEVMLVEPSWWRKSLPIGDDNKLSSSAAQSALSLAQEQLHSGVGASVPPCSHFHCQSSSWLIGGVSIGLSVVQCLLGGLVLRHPTFDQSECFSPLMFLRAIRYPVIPLDEAAESPDHGAACGVPPHYDHSWVTVLVPDPDVVGLEISRESLPPVAAELGDDDDVPVLQEQWQEIPPLPGCLVVNVGDALQFLSSYQYRSPYHRAYNPTKPPSRISVPLFLEPRGQPPEPVCGDHRKAAWSVQVLEV